MKNQLQSVNLIVQFDNGLCLEIRSIHVEDTNNISKIREEPLKLRKNLILAYDSKELSEAFTEHLKNSIKDFFSKFEVPSFADKEACLSIALDELKKTGNLFQILSSIEK